MLNHLTDVKVNNECSKKLISELTKHLKERFSGIFKNTRNLPQTPDISESCFFVSTFLDPCFKTYWLESTDLNDEESEIFQSRLKNLIKTEWERINGNLMSQQTQTQQIPSSLSTNCASSDVSISLLNSQTKRKNFFFPLSEGQTNQ